MPTSDPLRLVLASALLSLVGCGADSEPAPPQGYAAADVIDCYTREKDDVAQQCGLERSVVDGALELTVRHPDGHFRRFAVDGDGALTTADGMQPATVKQDGEALVVTVGDDAYLFPQSALETPAADPVDAGQ